MDNNELLLAISQMLDEKLAPIIERMDTLEQCMDTLEQHMAKLEQRMDTLEQRMAKLEQRMDLVEQKLECIEQRVTQLERKTASLAFLLETDVSPRLNTIEECYVSTSRRFFRYMNQIERHDTEITVLKDIVQLHSIRLQNIS